MCLHVFLHVTFFLTHRKYAELILLIANDGHNPWTVLPQDTKRYFSAIAVTVPVVDFESALKHASLGLFFDRKDGGNVFLQNRC
jgi:hypothetical protein